MAEKTFEIAEFALRSAWTDSARGSLATATKTVTVSGIPSGATFGGASMTVTLGSPLSGAYLSTIADIPAREAGTRTLDLSSIITGNGTYQIVFRFRANGGTAGSHYASMRYSGIRIAVTYETGATPEPEPEVPTVDIPSANEVCLFGADSEDWSTNGDVVLLNSRCIVTENAGEEYSIEIEHPMTADNRWKAIVPGAIVRAPVPNVVTPVIQLADASFWQAVDSVKVYARPCTSYVQRKEVTYTTTEYNEFKAGNVYYFGDIVTTGTGNVRYLWQYKYPTAESIYNPPTQGTLYWNYLGTVNVTETTVTETEEKTVSTKVVATLAAGEVFTKLADADLSGTWIRIRTSTNVEGFVKSAECRFYGDSKAYETVEARNIKAQCFRLYDVTISTASQVVTAHGLHISYDLQQVALGNCNIKGAAPSNAIAIMQAAEMGDTDARSIVTNITSGGVTITEDYSWKNALSAIIDPDIGFVKKLNARLIRDNNDIFLLNNDRVFKGYRIERGLNVVSMSWERSHEKVITRVIPRGKDERGEILLLPGNTPWIDSPNSNEFPVVRCEVLDVDAQVGKEGVVNGEYVQALTEEQVYSIMRLEASNRFAVDKADTVRNTVTVVFQELSDTVEYRDAKGLPELRMYDMVYVRDDVMGITDYLQMTGYKWNCTNPHKPYYESITLGDLQTHNQWNGFSLNGGAIDFSKLSSTAKSKIGAMIADATAE